MNAIGYAMSIFSLPPTGLVFVWRRKLTPVDEDVGLELLDRCVDLGAIEQSLLDEKILQGLSAKLR